MFPSFCSFLNSYIFIYFIYIWHYHQPILHIIWMNIEIYGTSHQNILPALTFKNCTLPSVLSQPTQVLHCTSNQTRADGRSGYPILCVSRQQQCPLYDWERSRWISLSHHIDVRSSTCLQRWRQSLPAPTPRSNRRRERERPFVYYARRSHGSRR